MCTSIIKNYFYSFTLTRLVIYFKNITYIINKNDLNCILKK